MEMIFIILCIPLYVLNSFCDKYVSTFNSKRVNALYNIIKFAVGSGILFVALMADRSLWSVSGVIICGVLCGIMYSVSKMIIMTGYEKSSVAFMTLCHSSGMLLPCIIGHFLWNEKLSFAALVGIALVIASVLLLKDAPHKKGTNSTIGFIIGIVVLLTSGGVMILQKIMGIYYHGQGVNAYNFYSFLSAFMILSAFMRGEKQQGDTKKLIWCALGSSVSLCVISIVMTKLASTVPSIIMFPLFNGSGIILVTLLSAWLFKEKLTPKRIIGFVVGLVGLFLVNL